MLFWVHCYTAVVVGLQAHPDAGCMQCLRRDAGAGDAAPKTGSPGVSVEEARPVEPHQNGVVPVTVEGPHSTAAVTGVKDGPSGA